MIEINAQSNFGECLVYNASGLLQQRLSWLGKTHSMALSASPWQPFEISSRTSRLFVGKSLMSNSRGCNFSQYVEVWFPAFSWLLLARSSMWASETSRSFSLLAGWSTSHCMLSFGSPSFVPSLSGGEGNEVSTSENPLFKPPRTTKRSILEPFFMP